MVKFKNKLELRTWIIQQIYPHDTDIPQVQLKRLTTILERCEIRYNESNDVDRILGSTMNLFRWIEVNLNAQDVAFSLTLADSIMFKVMMTVEDGKRAVSINLDKVMPKPVIFSPKISRLEWDLT